MVTAVVVGVPVGVGAAALDTGATGRPALVPPTAAAAGAAVEYANANIITEYNSTLKVLLDLVMLASFGKHT
jgi:uncharacterized membrane protein